MIPEDIRRAAERAWQPTSLECKQAIARAILAERERCEKIAKRVWRDADFYENGAVRRAVSLICCQIETGALQ